MKAILFLLVCLLIITSIQAGYSYTHRKSKNIESDCKSFPALDEYLKFKANREKLEETINECKEFKEAYDKAIQVWVDRAKLLQQAKINHPVKYISSDFDSPPDVDYRVLVARLNYSIINGSNCMTLELYTSPGVAHRGFIYHNNGKEFESWYYEMFAKAYSDIQNWPQDMNFQRTPEYVLQYAKIQEADLREKAEEDAKRVLDKTNGNE